MVIDVEVSGIIVVVVVSGMVIDDDVPEIVVVVVVSGIVVEVVLVIEIVKNISDLPELPSESFAKIIK